MTFLTKSVLRTEAGAVFFVLMLALLLDTGIHQYDGIIN